MGGITRHNPESRSYAADTPESDSEAEETE